MIWARGLVAFGVSLTFAPVVLATARRVGVLDVPSFRSSHSKPTPRAGGVAAAAGALIALALTPSVGGDARTALLVASGGFGAVGLLEDVVGVPALLRLAVQAGLGAITLPWLLAGANDSVALRVVVALLVVLWLVAYVNAFNFMDGINGISVAQVLVAGAAWYLVGRSQGVVTLGAAGVIVSGAALGFAPWNVIGARMFLGDVGSYFLGAWLAVTAVVGLRAGLPPEAVLAPLATYGADTGVTLVRRVLAGETWYAPHRDHTYQRLVRSGWSHVQTTVFVAAVVAICSALGAASLAGTVPRVLGDAGLALTVIGYLLAPRALGWAPVSETPIPAS